MGYLFAITTRCYLAEPREKSALEWLSGQRVLDSLSLYPEAERH